MANISDAHGVFNLVGDWKEEHIKVFIYMLLTQDIGSDYGFFELREQGFTTILGQLLQGEDCVFSATGRWSFSNNLEYFNEWMLVSSETWDKYVVHNLPEDLKINHKDFLNKRLWLLKEMYEKDLVIQWSFLDLETGIGFLDRVLGEHYSTKLDTGKYKLVYSDKERISYDCNLKNQSEIFDRDISRLDDAVQQIEQLYDLTPEQASHIKDVIESHETWFDIPAYPSLDSTEYMPEKLDAYIKKYVGIQ